MRIERFSELDSLIDASAQRLTQHLAAIHQDPAGGVHGDGTARIVLTGGTAGIELLRSLANQPIDWSRTHVFFGDERNVDVSHPDSNEGQAREALLDRVNIPEANIHGYGLDGGDMAAACAAYEEALGRYAPRGFDLHLLGMGGEGHINSLFPHTPAVAERERLVVPVEDSPKPPPQRATLTLPAVALAEEVWFLVSGAEKADAAAHLAAGADPGEWPAAGARGSRETVLFVTEDAAAQL